MKKIVNLFILGAMVAGLSSCEKYLDINDNPNTATEATPGLVLPQAIVGSASMTNTFSNNIEQLSGSTANAGGFGGFGAYVTYNYTTGNFGGMWTGTYDNMRDYEYVIENTSADPVQIYSTSIARIMKSFGFGRLVDQYNDIPYSEALKGSEFLTPKYDKAEDVYKDLVTQLTKAIADITTGQANAATQGITTAQDPMFKGDMNKWKQFANTLKLKMLVKMAGTPSTASFATTEFAALNTTIGFLTDDALVNPGYLNEAGRQSPIFASWGYDVAGTRVASSRLPSRWMFSFYNGGKLTDPGRGSVIYYSYPTTPINQLGDESAGVATAPSTASAFFSGSTSSKTGLGVVKGATQGQPVMLKAESDFLLAEAYARGYLTGNAATAFDNGITASFRYLYKNATDVVDPSKNVTADVATYKADNAGSFLVNYALAATLDQRIEAIITQKYIALNLIHMHEMYNEFRRTAYPRIVNGSTQPLETFASRQSASTRPDKMVSRVLYPQVEYTLNPANAPSGIGLFTSRIFWDLN